MEASEHLVADLREIFEKTRKEAITFALLTVALTPFLLGIAGLMFVFGMVYVSGDLALESDQGVMVFVVIFLFLALWSTWTQGGSQETWLPLGLTVVVALLTAAGPIGPLSWRIHLGLCGGLSFCALALMGRAYSPRDDLYLGDSHGRGDPFTLQDDIDRMHLAVGCATALPALVLGAFGEVFASSWLWHGVDDRVVRSSARVLRAVHRRNLDEVLSTIGHERGRVLDLLKRSNLVRIYNSKVDITDRGRALIST